MSDFVVIGNGTHIGAIEDADIVTLHEGADEREFISLMLAGDDDVAEEMVASRRPLVASQAGNE